MNRNIDTTEKKKEYFIYNKTRIIITEHFNDNGKQLSEIIEDAIKRSDNCEKPVGLNIIS